MSLSRVIVWPSPLQAHAGFAVAAQSGNQRTMWEVGGVLYEHPGGRRRNRKTGITVHFITLLKSPDPAREACRLQARWSKVPLRAQINTELASRTAPAREERRGRKSAHLVRRWAFRKARPGWRLRNRPGWRGKACSLFLAWRYLFLKLVYTPPESPGSH